MSSRRKRAPPVRMDEEAKKKVNWNMHEDRKNEAEFGGDEMFSEASVSFQPNSAPEEAGHSVAFSIDSVEKDEEPKCSSQDLSPDTTELNVVPFSTLDIGWKALIGEFNLYLKVPIEHADVTFCLQQTGNVLLINLPSTVLDKPRNCPVECSFGGLSLEDLDWLQKRKVIQLCHMCADGGVKVLAFKVDNVQCRQEPIWV